MAERIHPAPEIEEPTSLSPSADAFDVDPPLKELTSGDHPMLLLCKGPNDLDGTLVFHVDT